MLTIFDATSLPSHERFSYWHDEVCRTFYRSETVPLDADKFTARMATKAFDGVQISTIECAPLCAARSYKDVRKAPAEDFYISILHDGRAELQQQGRSARQRAGDVVMFDSSRPMTYNFFEAYRMSIIKIPRNMILARLPEAELLTSRTIAGSSAAGRLIDHILTGAMAFELNDPSTEANLGRAIAHLVATTVDAEFVNIESNGEKLISESRSAVLTRAQRLILSRLDDPDLSVSAVAAELGISESKLARHFADIGTSVMRWLWEERLKVANEMLRNEQVKRVTQVALGCGFTSFSHFSRRFKARFGQSPISLLKNRKNIVD